MSLYEHSESKLAELGDIISRAKETNGTLNSTANNMSDALTKFVVLSSDIQLATVGIQENQKHGITLYNEVLEEFTQTIAAICSENKALREQILELNNAHVEHQSVQLAQLGESVIEKQSVHFNQHKDFITQADSMVKEKLASLASAQANNFSKAKSFQRIVITIGTLVLLMTAADFATSMIIPNSAFLISLFK